MNKKLLLTTFFATVVAFIMIFVMTFQGTFADQKGSPEGYHATYYDADFNYNCQNFSSMDECKKFCEEKNKEDADCECNEGTCPEEDMSTDEAAEETSSESSSESDDIILE